jgi:hypothetical protein
MRNTIRMLSYAVTGMAIGLLLPSPAQADHWWSETIQTVDAGPLAELMGADRTKCPGVPIQSGSGINPEKDTFGCSVDVEYTGSVALPNTRMRDMNDMRRGNGWTIDPIGQATGVAERDTIGYVRRAP